MKRNELKEIKTLEPKEIFLRAKKIKEEITNIRMDRFNSTKSKQGATNLKDMYEKRKDVAQMLTIARQKQILGQLESRVKSPESSKSVDQSVSVSEKETKNSEKKIVMDNSTVKSKSKKKGRTELSNKK